VIDDSMIQQPAANGHGIEIVRGPNIGAPPSNTALPDTISGVVTLKVGDKITTDHIMPAGSRLKYRSNIPKYAEFVFERNDPDFAKKALANRDKGVHNIIVAGESYGQGSSREHAAICPMFLGVKLVVAKTMERIHRANLVNFGIVPALFVNHADYDGIEAEDRLEVQNLRQAIESGSRLVLKNLTRGTQIELTADITAREKKMILAGGLINATRGA
jgi:aconitate hydratase